MKFKPVFIAVSLLICMATIIPSSVAQSATPSTASKRLWNIRDADIRSIIEEVSRETGKNFIVDPRVQGRLSIVSSKPLSSDEVYRVFLSALQVAGFAAVPSGAVIKIVPSVDAKTLASRVTSKMAYGEGDQMLARVIPIKYVNAEQLVPVLRPLLPQWDTVSAYQPSNSIIMAGRADNLQRLVRIIDLLDSQSNSGIDMVRLKYANADDVVKTITTLRGNTFNSPLQNVNIAANDGSNAILLSGNQAQRMRVKVLIAQLDVPSAAGSGNTSVINVHYLQARDLAPILAGVARSMYTGPVSYTIGTRSQQQAYSSINTGLDQNMDPSEQASMGMTQGPEQGDQPAAQQTAQTKDSSGDKTKPKVEIIAELNNNAIILNAPPNVIRSLIGVIKKLDVRPSQVLVEAVIAEINDDDIKNLGIDWGSVVTERDNTGNIARTFQPGVAIINSETKLKNFEARITALEQAKKLNVLSTPTVMVLDNHQAKILIGQQVSIQTSSYPNNAGGTTGATPFNTFDRQNVALHLYVTPQVSEGKTVQMQIDDGNDDLANPTDAQSGRPVVNTSRITTSVLVNSGDLLILGGLKKNQLQRQDQSIPILGQIPVLGKLFHHFRDVHSKQTLVIFIRPKIIRSPQDGLNITADKYETLRHEELAWMHDQGYTPNPKDAHVVKPLKHKQQKLPVPFHHGK